MRLQIQQAEFRIALAAGSEQTVREMTQKERHFARASGLAFGRVGRGLGCRVFARASGLAFGRVSTRPGGAIRTRGGMIRIRRGGGVRRVVWFVPRTEHLDNLHGERDALLGTDQRQGEEGQPRHRLARQAGKEAIESMGLRSGFGHDRFITSEAGDIVRIEQMRTKEVLKQIVPGQDRGEEALDGAIASASARPAGDAQHGDPTRHREDRGGDPAPLPQGDGLHERGQTTQACERIVHGLLWYFRWCWFVTPTNDTTKALCALRFRHGVSRRPTKIGHVFDFQGADFGEGIANSRAAFICAHYRPTNGYWSDSSG